MATRPPSPPTTGRASPTFANLKNTNLWNVSFVGAKLERTKLKGAYWYMTACKDGTEGGLDSFLPCTKAQMSADPPLIDDPNYFESHLTNAPVADK